MSPANPEDRYLELARRIGDGRDIDWDSVRGNLAEEDTELVQGLRVVSEVGRVHREIHAAESRLASGDLPEAIGEYRIRRRLGSGGLGVVYEAEQKDSPGLVALKVIRSAHVRDPEAVRLFEREAKTLSRLHHPSIAGIYESGCTDDAQHFIAMELVRGRTLADWRSSRGVSPGDSVGELRLRLGLFRKICKAVAHAHQCGVIHRDLKPSNILVVDETPATAMPPVKILDFGLARATFLSGTSAPGHIRGTLPYMSPEQARGDPAGIDARTDIYSLGVILYELLTDSRPYNLDHDSFLGKVRAILTAPPRPLAEVWRGATPADAALEAILHKALQKEPVRRYPSVDDLIEDLDHHYPCAPDSAPEESAP